MWRFVWSYRSVSEGRRRRKKKAGIASSRATVCFLLIKHQNSHQKRVKDCCLSEKAAEITLNWSDITRRRQCSRGDVGSSEGTFTCSSCKKKKKRTQGTAGRESEESFPSLCSAQVIKKKQKNLQSLCFSFLILRTKVELLQVFYLLQKRKTGNSSWLEIKTSTLLIINHFKEKRSRIFVFSKVSV